ncbi:hypothetical protein Tsubulata_000079 [Turnera subulata]|uniref:RING-type E3 ubiquitin transferase n=1 Tax=Turnera subulata TaxID=218843 RepID=A0A9Q0FJE3_9ROSI|nr:hypothetical protein Tsubulata_000079 [Turnera subulata]
MDVEPERTSFEELNPTVGDHTNGNGSGVVAVDNGISSLACSLCRRSLEPDTDDPENINICGDCKFLLFEDLGTPFGDSHERRRPRRGRGGWNSSSESIEDLLSQQLPQIVSRMMQNLSSISRNEGQSVDSDAFGGFLARASTRTTPSGSRRWQRVLSDTESDGFDNMGSPYGESDANLRSGRYRIFQSESDAISFSAYGGDSDASVDGNSFLDTEIFAQEDAASNLDSDTDIDPMHAGLNQWESEEEEEEEDADEEDAVESTEARIQFSYFNSSPSDRANWSQRLQSPEFGVNRMMHQRMRQGRLTYNHDISVNLTRDAGNLGDYVTGFEQALQALAETDVTRRGAPPAAASFVHNLARVTINEEHEKHDGLACAICKDALTIGTEVNQLPCSHVYHPFCIMPWLASRNSCPLCRYELPTDDRDYEERKQNTSSIVGIHEIQQQDASEDSSSNVSDGEETDEPHDYSRSVIDLRELVDVDPSMINSAREGSGRGWFFLAAAPIFSLLGIVIVMWLGNSRGRGPTGQCNPPEGTSLHIQVPGPSQPNQRANRRRWWFPF